MENDNIDKNRYELEEEARRLLRGTHTKEALLSKSVEELAELLIQTQQTGKHLWRKNQKLEQEKIATKEKHVSEVGHYLKLAEDTLRDYYQMKHKAQELQKLVDLKLGRNYNENAPWIDKIVFVLQEAARPMRSAEIIEVLERNDSYFRTIGDRQKALSPHLTRALKYGRIIGEKQKGQNGYLFSLPKEPK
jgi:hypothetical protein